MSLPVKLGIILAMTAGAVHGLAGILYDKLTQREPGTPNLLESLNAAIAERRAPKRERTTAYLANTQRSCSSRSRNETDRRRAVYSSRPSSSVATDLRAKAGLSAMTRCTTSGGRRVSAAIPSIVRKSQRGSFSAAATSSACRAAVDIAFMRLTPLSLRSADPDGSSRSSGSKG